MTDEKIDDLPELTSKDREKNGVPDHPPIIRLPMCPIPKKVIEYPPSPPTDVEVITTTERCLQVVARLEREALVAVATEGINVGREGPITLVQIATCGGTVYIFDVIVNRDLVEKGRIKVILENEKILKVMNECSSPSAAFNYQFAVTLQNVFDTQIAHLVIEEHKGRQLPTRMKLSEICLHYCEDPSKYYTYDWRADTKEMWSKFLGNFWGQRPMTSEMVEFAAGDVLVLIPDVYRNQAEYLEANGLKRKYVKLVFEEILLELDDVVKEERGERIAGVVEAILRRADEKYGNHTKLFGIFDPDEINALELVTVDDAKKISHNILRLKYEHILQELADMEGNLRLGVESWHFRKHINSYLQYIQQNTNEEIRSKSTALFAEMKEAFLTNIESKHNRESTTHMLSVNEKEFLQSLEYTSMQGDEYGPVVKSLYWKLVQEEIHQYINLLRLYPREFSMPQDVLEKLKYFSSSRNLDFVPEGVVSLAAALLDALHVSSSFSGRNSYSNIL
ncbi:hypothetical protein CHS0354_004975 [Potamilus streckersoni]|uniref:3'-5' exonuclease domain-containing protein n=1 Tax=Potamilus streckersoni TaxID=2493646 RepID=A0AAE0W089_9BIVA|nr:hypothetical protein CHS0354_004975 [Potamilus streckersoni]